MLQDTFLLNGTVAEHIGYAVPEATMEEIRAAAAANIHEDISAMPEGYEKQVGERGLRLSGGHAHHHRHCAPAFHRARRG